MIRYTESDYHYVVAWSDRDACYICRVVDFPGLMADGETEAEALTEAGVAVRAALEVSAREGIEVPTPSAAGRENP